MNEIDVTVHAMVGMVRLSLSSYVVDGDMEPEAAERLAQKLTAAAKEARAKAARAEAELEGPEDAI